MITDAVWSLGEHKELGSNVSCGAGFRQVAQDKAGTGVGVFTGLVNCVLIGSFCVICHIGCAVIMRTGRGLNRGAKGP